MNPSLLYGPNSILVLHSHQSPPPFDAPYPSRRTRAVNQFLNSFSKLEVCLKLPPSEAPQLNQQTEIQFRILKEISIKNGYGAQVVLGMAYFPTQSYILIAKIYDPLFYPGPNPTSSRFNTQAVDFTVNADRDYTREVAAYSELDSHLGGIETPKYYGSWTCNVPVDQDITRPVRLILLEHISGKSMLDLKPTDFNQDKRDEIMSQIFEIVVKITYFGVQHMDLFLRNFLIDISETDTKTETKIRVVIIDFNNSIVHRFAGYPILKNFISSIPNPPYNFTNSDFEEWQYTGWLRKTDDWKIKRWGSIEPIPLPKAYFDAMWERKMIMRNSYVEKLPPLSEFSLDFIVVPPSVCQLSEGPENKRLSSISKDSTDNSSISSSPIDGDD